MTENKSLNRNLILTGEITDESVKEITEAILEINRVDNEAEDETYEIGQELLELVDIIGENVYVSPKLKERKPIYLYIDSFGGSAYSGIGLVNVIENSITPVVTVVTGSAMSIALIIAMAGRYRLAYKNSTFMFHDVSFGIYSDSMDIKRETKEADRLAKVYKNYVCENSYIDGDTLEKYIERRENWYFDGIEAENLGVVDELIDYQKEEETSYDICDNCGQEYGDCECDV